MDETVSMKFSKCTLRGGTGEDVHSQQVVSGDEIVKTRVLGSVLNEGRIGR